MNIFLYTMLFLIGALVGNFWKMAIYRIPRNIELTKKIFNMAKMFNIELVDHIVIGNNTFSSINSSSLDIFSAPTPKPIVLFTFLS